MTNPIAIHIISLAQVSHGKESICRIQIPAPKMGISGTHGVLNGRGISGFFTLRMMIPMQTMAKASNVPIETSSPRILIGRIPASISATKPVMRVLTYGVLKRECTFENTGGNSPSFDIEKKILGCPISITSMTELKPAIAAILMIGRSQNNPLPMAFTPTAIGSATFRKV